MKKHLSKKILGFAVAALIIFGLSANLNNAYAYWQGNNLAVHNGLIANFKYEKTIDMTNMKDRSKIPNADFNFVISTIDEDKEEAYHIGKHYENEETGVTRTIYPGKLFEVDTNGTEDEYDDIFSPLTSKLFSSVSFKETDGFDPEFTRLMDVRDDGSQLITHILKYDWGEMRSNDHIQTAISRQPVGEELKYWLESPAQNSWPTDTVVWRCFHEYGNDWYEKFLEDPINNRVGSYEQGCQLVNEYNFETFDYVTKFNLHLNPAVTYVAYSYKKPLLTHQSTDKAGNYTSVSKGLLTTEKYEEWHDNFEKWNEPEGVDLPVYRYILTEEPTAGSTFAQNEEVKIVDYYLNDYYPSYVDLILMFDSVEEADAFYDYVTNNDIQYLRALNQEFIPKTSFTNRPAPAPEPEPKPEPKPEPDPTPEPKNPPKHDLRYARDDFYEEKKSEKVQQQVITIYKESVLPKTGDTQNLPVYVGAFGLLLLSAGVYRFRRNN